MTKSNEFPEGAALLGMLLKNTDGQLGKLFDLRNIHPKGLEIEQKYELLGKEPIGKRYAGFIEKIGPVARSLGYETSDDGFMPYQGFDQYYVTKNKRGDSAIFRHRFSANVPATLTVKTQLRQGENLIRGEFNLPVPDAEMQSVRAFMAVVCQMIYLPKPKHFCIYQGGIFWTLIKPNGETCEVVIYKVGELGTYKPRLFVEIEPKNFDSSEQALKTIRNLEAKLGLKKMRCNKSIAEIFG